MKMNRDKQIEEMARIICPCNKGGICECDGKSCDLDCTEGKEMKVLYNAGYRKTSEVAREIFAEIEKLFFANGVFIHIQSYNELKKKYAEGEG